MRRNKFWWLRVYAKEGGEGSGGEDGAGGGGSGGEGGAGGGGSGGEDGAGGEGSGGQEQPYWPNDWQNRLATKLATEEDDQKKLAARFARYATLEDMAKGFIATQDKIRSGQLKAPLAKDATEEEIASWRKDNGIPDNPKAYNLDKFDSGLVIGEEDKPFVDGFAAFAHAQNFTEPQLKGAVEWYFENQEKVAAEQEERDAAAAQATTDALNLEWGSNYRRYINTIQSTVIDKIPEDVRAEFMNARMPDGTALFNSELFLKGLANLALELNPAGTLVPASGSDPMKGVEDEIAEIEKTMRENRAAYNKDEKIQSRYRELIDAREKLKNRNGNAA